jgi:hypothetical protein
LLLAALWAIVATVVALIPSRDRHWRAAYVLITVGIPIVGWVTYQNGPWIGLIVLGAGASILRWPLIRLWHWLKRKAAN